MFKGKEMVEAELRWRLRSLVGYNNRSCLLWLDLSPAERELHCATGEGPPEGASLEHTFTALEGDEHPSYILVVIFCLYHQFLTLYDSYLHGLCFAFINRSRHAVTVAPYLRPREQPPKPRLPTRPRCRTPSEPPWTQSTA